MNDNDDGFHDECGVFGIFEHEDAATLAVMGLHALQHRGQEATGIVSFDGEEFHSHRASETVGKAYGDPDIMKALAGHSAVGHNRYSTTGETSTKNIQPLYADFTSGGFALAHNGNLTNAGTLRQKLVKEGSLFQCTSDTEVILHLMALSKEEFIEDRMIEALKQVTGAYSLIGFSGRKMIGVRDPYGIRPLALGKLDDSYVLSSESCGLDIIGAEFIRDIEPGEIVVINKEGIQSRKPFEQKPPRFCIFEYIYFARPDSVIDKKAVYEMRKNIGAELVKESPCSDADLVIPVPDSGVPAAIGFAQASGLPFDLGIIRSHYVGRTFIQPTDSVRHLGVKMKHNANRALIEGKKVVLVDDSIVRGTTSKKIVDLVRSAGAKEVHVRISSPPTTHGCFYGIDTPSTEKLVAHSKTVEEIRDLIGADSLAYISVDGLYRAIGHTKRNGDMPQYCDACFTGDYMIELTDHENNVAEMRVTNLREHQK